MNSIFFVRFFSARFLWNFSYDITYLHSNFKVAWIHIDRQMILTIHRHVISRIPRYSITYDNANTWLLHVNQAQQDDRGYYMCQVIKKIIFRFIFVSLFSLTDIHIYAYHFQVNTNPMISQVGYLQVVGM